MPGGDIAYLLDMREAAREAQEFVAGVSYREYLSNRLVQAAVERQIEIIGEAARRVSDAFCTEHPEIPWRGIITQRNVLAHDYGEILIERIWVSSYSSPAGTDCDVERCDPVFRGMTPAPRVSP